MQAVLLTPEALPVGKRRMGEIFTVFSYTLQAGLFLSATNSRVRMTCGWLICTTDCRNLLYGHTLSGVERLPVLFAQKGSAGRVAEVVFMRHVLASRSLNISWLQ